LDLRRNRTNRLVNTTIRGGGARPFRKSRLSGGGSSQKQRSTKACSSSVTHKKELHSDICMPTFRITRILQRGCFTKTTFRSYNGVKPQLLPIKPAASCPARPVCTMSEEKPSFPEGYKPQKVWIYTEQEGKMGACTLFSIQI